jgi:two-component system, cell cycle sensor histidine kinase and response regulator CckA
MPLPFAHQLSAELAELLSGDDARACLEQALARLAEVGIRQVPPRSAGVAISVSAGEQVLSLAGCQRDVALALTPLLRLAIKRAVEQDEHVSTQERLQLLSEASFEGILVHVDGVVIDVNQRLAEMVRCRPEDLLGPDTIQRTTAPEDLAAALQRVASGYEGAYTITAVRSDGSRFRAEVQSKQGRLGDRPVRIAAVRDVTERERTLSLLRESEKHMQDLVLGAFDFMVVTRKGLLVHVAGKVQDVTGYTAEEMVGRDALDFVAAAGRAATAAALAENRVGTYETIVASKSGEEIPVEVMGVHSTFEGEPARVAGFRDLRGVRRLQAERRKLELQLQRSQRLDSLGVLAGGIAHDFNNLLVGVLGNASLLLATLKDPTSRQAAEAIMTAGERAASLTRQMLAYAGRQDLSRREPVDLNELFKELRTLLDATLSKKAALRFMIAPGSIVVGDRAPLTQVMMNLLTNASDALEDQPGKIDVRTSLVNELDERWDDALGAGVGPGDWVLIEVQDDGVGMDEATRQRVFEPFFSTKEHGHGLGLAACLGIVSSHGGALLLESERGKGSCFSVVLPATTRRADALKSDPPALSDEPCRVLVIDDEQLVRTQLRRSLELRGYEVDEACNGLSGLARHAEWPADVLVVDMTMPDIDGAEVVRRVRASGSRVAIVLSSGYQAQAAADRLDSRAYQVFLPKPYGMNELVHAIEKARVRALSL